MRIVRLHLRNYRNLHETVLDPHPRFNVIHGRNAQGKTNLLEAVYLLATLKSFRSVRGGDLVAFALRGDEGEPEGAEAPASAEAPITAEVPASAEAEAIVERRGVERTYHVRIDRSGRTASVDGKRIERLSQYFGHFNVVLFTPEDLAISKGDPGTRRRYLDRAVFNADPGHVDLLRAYERALRSRNALLREGAVGGPNGAAMMAAFDQPLVDLAARVVLRRQRYLEGLGPVVRAALREISGTEHDVGLRYRCSIESGAPTAGRPEVAAPDDERLAWLRAQAERRLAETLDTDRARGYTGVGPHMDDLVASLDGKPLRRFGSQGQHRSFVLALKIAEIDYLQEVADFRPILLLDDVSSELDEGRGRRFLALVREKGGQVFVTTTDRRHVPIEEDVAVWRIEDGAVTPEELGPAPGPEAPAPEPEAPGSEAPAPDLEADEEER